MTMSPYLSLLAVQLGVEVVEELHLEAHLAGGEPVRGPGAGPDVPPALLEEGLGHHEVVLGDLEEEVRVVPGKRSKILNFTAKFLKSGSCCTSRGRGRPRRSRAPPRRPRRARPRSSCASAGVQFNRKQN